MSKSHYVTVGALVVLGGIAVWQFMEISALKEANASLMQQAKAGPSLAKSPVLSGPEKMGKAGAAGTPGGTEGAENPEAAARTAEETARAAQFRKMRQMDRVQRQDAKILALTTKLNLTPEQAAAVRAALEKGSAERDAIRDAGDERRRAGTPDSDEKRRADMATFAAIETAQEANITAGMSADQLAAYSEYKTEQKQSTVESQANRQLGDLSNKFSLTEEQKEAAFQYYAAQEQDNGFDPARLAAEGADMRTVFEQRQKQQLEAMKQILTPEQFELFNTQEEQRSTMFREMTPGGPVGGPGGPRRP